MSTNLHPADELARIRSQIRTLEEREGQLREELLSGRCGLEGDDHVAQIQSMSREWVSLREARQALGAALDPFVTEKTVRMVRVASKSGNGDATE